MIGSSDQNFEPSALESEANAWVRRITSGQATAADAAALGLWRNQSPEHAAAFLSASRLWKDLEPAGRDWRRRAAAASARVSAPHPDPSLSRRFVLGGGLAAASAAAAYAFVHPPLGLWPSWTEMRADYRTATGQQRDVALSDAVSIRLNTQTSIAVQPPDSDAERVELIGGEASFSIEARDGRSLAVRAADRWITAKWAQFDVRHLRGRMSPSICVTCLKGSLSIARGSDIMPIAAGQQLRYDGSGSQHVETIDPDIASAWQRGVLIFRSTPLADVVDEINRYRPGRIVVTNAEIGRIPVSGHFRIADLDQILIQMQQAFGATVRSLPGGLMLLS